MVKHRIIVSGITWGSLSFSRYTCQACQDTLVKQASLSAEDWRALVIDFLTRHMNNGAGAAVAEPEPVQTGGGDG